MMIKRVALLLGLLGASEAFVVPSVSRASGAAALSASTLKEDPAISIDTSRPNSLSVASRVYKQQPYGEESRKYRRNIYTYDDWVKHRSEDRFLKNLTGFYKSGVLRNLYKEVGVCVLIATGVIAANCLFNTGYDDLSGVHHAAPLVDTLGFQLPFSVPLTSWTISSPALSLLLVFRTNTCYKRWDEARKQWGKTLTQARNILRQSATWANPQIEPDVVKRAQALDEVGTWTWMTMYTLAASLGSPQDKAEWEQVVRDTLNEYEAEELINARHRPSRAHLNLSRAINAMPINKFQKLTLDDNAMNFADLIGAQERLFLAPIPLVYTRFTARFITGWLLTLPLGLWSAFKDSWNHIELIPVVAVVCTFFFGIEELAITLEEPFSVLPMDNFWGNVKKTAFEMRDWHVEESELWNELDPCPVTPVADVPQQAPPQPAGPQKSKDPGPPAFY